jgi:hypothetical protein
MKIEAKIQEAKTRFKTGTQFYSVDYPNWTRPNIQIDDTVEIRSIPNMLWVKAQVPFGEIMWVPIYDSNKDQWAKIEGESKNKNKK